MLSYIVRKKMGVLNPHQRAQEENEKKIKKNFGSTILEVMDIKVLRALPSVNLEDIGRDPNNLKTVSSATANDYMAEQKIPVVACFDVGTIALRLNHTSTEGKYLGTITEIFCNRNPGTPDNWDMATAYYTDSKLKGKFHPTMISDADPMLKEDIEKIKQLLDGKKIAALENEGWLELRNSNGKI